MGVTERASEASSVEQVKERAVRANERADKGMARPSTHRFDAISTQSIERLEIVASFTATQSAGNLVIYVSCANC